MMKMILTRMTVNDHELIMNFLKKMILTRMTVNDHELITN